MATLAKLVVKLITDVTEFSKGMDSAATKLSRVGDSMTKVGDRMTKNITLPLLAVGTAAVKMASDLEETKNKTSVVFGSMAEDVLKFSEGSAEAMGMSQQAALDYASTYGSIISNMGVAENQTAAMSKSLVELTADYASFHNLNPGEAFEKIKAGLVGSSEPLISLGKDLRVASVEAYAVANGIATAGEKMTNEQLAMARFGTLLAQSTKEMGDFARTSDGLANSSRIVTAQVQDVAAAFGKELIPVAVEFMQVLIPLLKRVNEMPPATKKSIVSILAFAAAAGPVLSVVGRLVKGVSWLVGLFGTGGGLAGAGAWLSSTFTSLSGAASAAGAAIAGVSAPVLGLIAAVGALVLAIKFAGPQAWETLKMLGTIFIATMKRLDFEFQKFIFGFVLKFQNLPKKLGDGARAFFAAGRNLMIGLAKGVQSATLEFVTSVMRPVQYVIDSVNKLLRNASPSKVFAGIGANMMLGMMVGVNATGDKPVSAAKQVVQNVSNSVRTVNQVSGKRTAGSVPVIGPIHIYGDLSESAQKSLEVKIRKMFGEELAAAFG
jgi:hypothetical protein